MLPPTCATPGTRRVEIVEIAGEQRQGGNILAADDRADLCALGLQHCGLRL